ncbi:hypothetical protein ACFENY_004774 [Salmonella enterica]|nr:hypothetical protein [Salmonella enterica]EHM5605803.1 hypothetical protein [Salmonella enterica subsp. enterica serovar Urbana]EFR3639848.1 hypothetical protein [Salmonella enterica]EGB4213815.1 hypothetical protein [Salmonella enterica]EGC8262493.1 hypothetical protein [Salmonella enterica]
MPDIRIRRKPATAFAQPGVCRIDVAERECRGLATGRTEAAWTSLGVTG